MINAADDIYETLMCRHTRADLLDDLHDFWIYVILNVVIAAFVVIVAVLGQDHANHRQQAMARQHNPGRITKGHLLLQRCPGSRTEPEDRWSAQVAPSMHSPSCSSRSRGVRDQG